MKKKLSFAIFLLIAFLFTGCDSSSLSPYGTMTIVNDSTETITLIEVNFETYYIDVNCKREKIYYNSLDDGQEVEQNESVEFTLPPVTEDSEFYITIQTLSVYSHEYVYITSDYECGTDFTLTFNGYDQDFELNGVGVSLK